ncbi:hypothetical protein TWF718_006240 [Orbilia javanica]|uniref:Uncharacterized protein n=1 Tax=Orbilia javanica TaxID=47235 RepID=A0AAN8RET9_9PEZI
MDVQTVRSAEKAVPPQKLTSKKGINYSRSDREIMDQFSDSMDLDSPASYGTRSVGRRHASLPTRLVGNASRSGRSDLVMGEDTSPSTNRSLASIMATPTPPGPRFARAPTLLTRRQILEQAKEHDDTFFEDV